MEEFYHFLGNLILRLRKVGARLEQGWGKVWTKSKVRARSGQARSGQGWGKVGARSGQKARFGQGRGKLAASLMYFTLITSPSLSPASITNQSHYHYLMPQPCPNLPQPCPDLACPDLARTLLLSRPCPNLAQDLAPTLPRPCPDLAPTLRRRSIKLPFSSFSF